MKRRIIWGKVLMIKYIKYIKKKVIDYIYLKYWQQHETCLKVCTEKLYGGEVRLNLFYFSVK